MDNPHLFECCFCHKTLDDRTTTVWNYISGWVKKRGSPGKILFPIAQNKHMCDYCMSNMREDVSPFQPSLFDASV